MSFSSTIKKDLCTMEPESRGCKRAELSGIIASSGTITVDETGKMCFEMNTENPALAGRIFSTIKGLYNITPKVTIQRIKKFKDHRSYNVKVLEDEAVQRILKDLRILKRNTSDCAFFTNEIPGFFLSKQRYTKSYIRGVFLACGSISNPEKNYHLELVCKQKSYLKSILELLSDYSIKGNLIKRKTNYVLYLKESESISSFLSIIGAFRALLEIENIRIVKEMRNGVNRQVNCETANMNKTATAAIEQIEQIRRIAALKGLETLPDNLRLIAELRLAYPDLTIKELGEKADPPIGKSGVYHRIKKLTQIAESLE